MLGATHACANPLTQALRHDARRGGLAAAAARRAVEQPRRGQPYAELAGVPASPPARVALGAD